MTELTIREAAAAILGDATYDTALPQPWLDAVADLPLIKDLGYTYGEILASFVWSYDQQAGIFGRPCALSVTGNEILALVNAYQGSHYPLTENPVA